MRWDWVQELRDKTQIAVKWVPTGKNKAVIFTKCLPNWKFQDALTHIRGRERSDLIARSFATAAHYDGVF